MGEKERAKEESEKKTNKVRAVRNASVPAAGGIWDEECGAKVHRCPQTP